MKFAIIGKSLPHTLSPKIHNEFFHIDYTKIELNENQLSDFFASKKFDGFNVTIPYKETVIPFLDEVSSEALNIGAVNTVVNKNGKFFGYNTDIFGLEYGLKSLNVDLLNKTVLVLGSGGTSKTACYLLKKFTDKVFVVSRTGKVNYQNCYDIDADIVINTTPIGMFPNDNESPVELTKFKNLKAVYDVVYNPLNTKLVLDAIKLSIPAKNGLGMLVAQAVKAKDLFLDKKTDESEIDKVLVSLQKELKNILFVGMPSSGKSTIAKILAKKLDREFVDTDLLIEKTENISIPKIFETKGEDYFRNIETKVLKGIVSNFSKVIATGGGIILKEENRELIKKNSFVVYLKRDIDKLSTKNRPLSKDKETLIKMQEVRKPFYEELADIIIDNNSDLESAIEEILVKYEKNSSY